MAPVKPWLIFFLVWCAVPCLTETPANDTHLDVTEAEEWEDAVISLLNENETTLAEGTALSPPNTERQHTTLYSTTADPGITTTGSTPELPDHEDPLTTPADTQGTSKVLAVTRPPLLVKDSGLPVQSRAAALPSPVTNVSSLCVCDLLVERCDVNCCCDPVCTASDFSVFSGCSVPVVTSNSRLCVQDTVIYSINSSSAIPQRVVQNVKIINPDVFCVQATNYQPAFSFITPDIPTQNNFDSLLKEFGGLSFNTAINTANSVDSTAARAASRYTYGSPILTPDSFFKLPASLGTNTCTDSNPIGFLVSQDLKCSRNITISNCSVGALALGTYKDIVILTVPNSQSKVYINVTSITLQSINGTLTPGIHGAFTPSYDDATQICKFVVLRGSYLVTYSDQGIITNIKASFTLGAINRAMLPIQQSFKIRFTEEEKNTSSLSGNPGYIVGLPLVAGFKLPQSGIIQSTNRFNQLTILKSSTTQDCLAEDGNRATVLFGHNMLSGCTLRYSILNSTTCQLAEDVVLNVLRGQQFPEYVAMFGNSQPENVLDWVPITDISPSPQVVSPCKIPVSLELEVRWTKYGSLINPQAKIVNVTQKITHVFIPEAFYGSKKLLQITASVSFVDVSAPAQPGYKAQPTLDAKLPFDFFYPFV